MTSTADVMAAWPIVALGEVARQVERPETPVTGMSYRQVGVRLWGQGAYERESIDGGATQYKTLSRVEANDIIVNKIWARNGSVSVIQTELAGAYVSGEFPTYVADPDRLLPQWFFWLTKTRSFWSQCDELSRGTSGKNRIRPEKFLQVRVPLPPHDEQRRIVARIEKVAVRIEEAKRLRREAIAEALQLWESGVRALIGQSVGELCPLGELVTMQGGGTPSKANPFYWQGNIPWISPKDMKTIKIVDAADHINEIALSESAARLIKPGAVLVVTRGMILAHTVPAAILGVPAAINQDMKALIPGDSISAEYLCATLRAYNKELVALVDRSSHDTRKLETPKLLAFPLPVPSREEQQRLVKSFQKLQTFVNSLKQLQMGIHAELDTVLPSVLNKAFRGEL